jgi:hypothetical protein
MSFKHETLDFCVCKISRALMGSAREPGKDSGTKPTVEVALPVSLT